MRGAGAKNEEFGSEMGGSMNGITVSTARMQFDYNTDANRDNSPPLCVRRKRNEAHRGAASTSASK